MSWQRVQEIDSDELEGIDTEPEDMDVGETSTLRDSIDHEGGIPRTKSYRAGEIQEVVRRKGSIRRNVLHRRMIGRSRSCTGYIPIA